MKLIIHATPERYREKILDPDNMGRLPLAWLTFGHLEGHGWGFVHPWAQQALFPGKGKYGADTDPDQTHEPFLIVRLWSFLGIRKHPNHEEAVAGRYWRGFVWRKSWRRPKWKVLDPDRIPVSTVIHKPGDRGFEWRDA